METLTTGQPWQRVSRRSIWLAAFVAAALFACLPQLARAEWRTLTGPMPDFVNGIDYIISPDSHYVAFTADMDTDDVVELYAMPITGTTPIKLNPPLVEGGDVNAFRITFTPDSQFVLYLADQEVDNQVELYLVPVEGGTAQKVSGALVAGGNVAQYVIDEESLRAVYLADAETNETFELWSIPLASALPTKVSGAMVTGGNVGIFRLDPLSDRVVYSADAETDGKFELYSALVIGGGGVKLNPPIVLTGGGDSGIYSDFEVNPIIPVVVFTARQTGATGGRVYSVPTAGGTPQQLSFDLTATQRILSFRISPLGDRVVFNVGTRLGSTNAFKGKLHSNLIGAGGLADVTASPSPLFGTDNYRFLPDGSRLVYSFQIDEDARVNLESATVLGVRSTLYAPGASDPQLSTFAFSPDSAWVIFQITLDGLTHRIYTIPPTGGSPTSHGNGRFHLVTPDSSRIAYARELDVDRHTDLYTAQIFGGGERNLSDLHPAGYILTAKASPDSAWILFLVQIDGRYELRVSDGAEAQPPLDGLTATNDGPKVTGAPISLTATITSGVGVSYTWTFGDGGTGSGATPSHGYSAAGVYTATVTATNSTGTMTATTTVYVGDAVVEVTDNQYTPGNVTIRPGGSVVWVLKEGNHSVTADDGSFEQPAGTDWGVFMHTFHHAPAPGNSVVIPYHCSVHGSSMAGSVTVSNDAPLGNKVLLPLIDR